MEVKKSKNPEYTYISWDVDTTGRRLIDEICHLAAYCPDTSFKQYVMPHRDIDYNSKKRYLLKTVNIGFYRVLREIGGKILKTKSEVSALNDFVNWLEQTILSQGNDGIILMHYETFTPASFILIESLKKYDLLTRFKNSVKGFANCFNFIKLKCEKSMQTYSIKTLAKILLNKEQEKQHDAFERSRIVYEIVDHLAVGESQDGVEDLEAGLESHIRTIEDIEAGIADMKITLNKQNSFKPIFGPIIRIDKMRRQALILRRHLTNADIDYETLKDVWTRKEEIRSFLKSNLNTEVSDEDITELDTIIMNHFTGNGNGVGSFQLTHDKNRSGAVRKTNQRRNKNAFKSSLKTGSKNRNFKKHFNEPSTQTTPTTAETPDESANKQVNESNATTDSTSEIVTDDDSGTAGTVSEISESNSIDVNKSKP